MSGRDGPALPADVRHVAVVCPTWVGDTVMATPVLRGVRAHRPGARVTALVRPGLEPILDGGPDADDVRALDPAGLLGPLRAGRTLRRLAPDAVVLLPNSLRSALAARLGGVPIRIGYRRDGRGPLLTRALAVPRTDRPVPAPTYYLRLLADALALAPETLDAVPRLATTPAEEAAADELLRDVDAPFLLLNPGANRSDKRWPAERFAAVADAMHAAHGLAAVVTGAPREAGLVGEVLAHARTPLVDLVARGVGLGPLKAVARRAAVMITNDTGPRHIASALGTPVVTLFGPTDHRWTTPPGPRERHLLAEPFLPEELVADGHAKLCAIDRIAIEDVVRATEALVVSGTSAPPSEA